MEPVSIPPPEGCYAGGMSLDTAAGDSDRRLFRLEPEAGRAAARSFPLKILLNRDFRDLDAR